MIPDTPQAIGFLAQRLLTHVLPELKTNFATADVALLTTLLTMVGQDFDRAAQVRLQDIQEMRALFARAAELPELQQRHEALARASAKPLDDLRVQSLDDLHGEHAQLLIDLHRRSETLRDASPAARRLDEAIWAYYERHAERHRYDVAF